MALTCSVPGTCFTLSGTVSVTVGFTMGLVTGSTCFTDFSLDIILG